MGHANIGLPELLIIFAIIVLLFGASRLPGLGKSVGQSVRGFKSGLAATTKKSPRRSRASRPTTPAPPAPPTA